MSEIQVRTRYDLAQFQLAVDFTLPCQGIHGIVGPSGCGKTTLLRLIAGLTQSTRNHSGKIIINQQVWQDQHTALPPWKRACGVIFQESRLFTHLNVQQNLAYGLKRIRARPRRLNFEEVVEALNISHLLRQNCHHLSGGERQRVAIARALLSSPDLLLMDEPLSALDYQARAEILPYLEKLYPVFGIPSLYVSHDLDEVARLCDQILLMRDGRLIRQDAANTILTDLQLELQDNRQAVAFITAQVDRYLPQDKLYRARVAENYLYLPAGKLSAGQSVRIQIHARDVSLSLHEHHDSSILNIVAVQVMQVKTIADNQVLVSLALSDGQQFLSAITQRSRRLLAIQAGMRCFAQIKAVSLFL